MLHAYKRPSRYSMTEYMIWFTLFRTFKEKGKKTNTQDTCENKIANSTVNLINPFWSNMVKAN